MTRLGFEMGSGRCKTVEIRASTASARGIPTACLLSGTRGLRAPMSVSSGYRIEVTTPRTPYQTSAGEPLLQRPPNNRMQATAGGLGVDMPARRAFARRT
jgi:hypothetical protein